MTINIQALNKKDIQLKLKLTSAEIVTEEARRRTLKKGINKHQRNKKFLLVSMSQQSLTLRKAILAKLYRRKLRLQKQLQAIWVYEKEKAAYF